MAGSHVYNNAAKVSTNDSDTYNPIVVVFYTPIFIPTQNINLAYTQDLLEKYTD